MFQLILHGCQSSCLNKSVHVIFPTPIPKTSEHGQSSASFYFKVLHVMVPTNSSDLISSSIFFYSFHSWSWTFLHWAETFNSSWLYTYPRITLILELSKISLCIDQIIFSFQELTQMLTPCETFSESTSHQYFLS